MTEEAARRILLTALAEDQCAELLIKLFEGAAVTLDAMTGQLVFLEASAIEQFTQDQRDR